MKLNELVKIIIQEMLSSGEYDSITTIHKGLKQKGHYSLGYSHFCTAFKKEGFKKLNGFGKRGRRKKSFSAGIHEKIQKMLASEEYGTVAEVYEELKQEEHYSNNYAQFNYLFKREDFKTPKKFGKSGPRKGKANQNETRIKLILQYPPLTLEEITEKEMEETGWRVTRQAINNYMMTRDYHTQWKERRGEYIAKQKSEKKYEKTQDRERQNAQQELLHTIKAYYIQRALHEDKPKGYAAAYYYSVRQRSNSISLEELEGFFEDYFDAKERNIQLSLQELGEKHSIATMSESHILKRVGLEPLYGSLERKVTPTYKKAALKRAVNLEMNTRDIAYFIGVEDHIAYQDMRVYGRANNRKFELARFGNRHNIEFLFYRHASQVYEANDCGFSPKETQQLADVSPKAYDFIMQNRTTIEPVIITALRTIYAAEKHSLPYVTAELKEHLKSQSKQKHL